MTKMRSTVMWDRPVGSLQWKSSIVLDGDHVLVSTSGLAWNEADHADGVLCLDAYSGEARWFCPTSGDANEIAVVNDKIIVGSDDGNVYAICRDDGSIRSKMSLSAPVYSRPLVFEDGKWSAILATHDGSIVGLSRDSDAFEHIGGVPYTIRAGLLAAPTKDCVTALAETGEVIAIEIGVRGFDFRLLNRISYPDQYAKSGISTAGLFGTPSASGEHLVLGYVRQTSYEHPPLLCIEAASGREIWRAALVPNEDFGNVRTSPLIVGNQVLAAFAYTDSLYSFDLKTGDFLWKVKLGLTAFQQWSSPVLRAPNEVILGRIDGVLSKVDILDKRLVWSRSLAPEDQSRESDLDNISIYPGQSPVGGICSTPAANSSAIFVGLTSGRLFRIED